MDLTECVNYVTELPALPQIDLGYQADTMIDQLMEHDFDYVTDSNWLEYLVLAMSEFRLDLVREVLSKVNLKSQIQLIEPYFLHLIANKDIDDYTEILEIINEFEIDLMSYEVKPYISMVKEGSVERFKVLHKLGFNLEKFNQKIDVIYYHVIHEGLIELYEYLQSCGHVLRDEILVSIKDMDTYPMIAYVPKLTRSAEKVNPSHFKRLQVLIYEIIIRKHNGSISPLIVYWIEIYDPQVIEVSLNNLAMIMAYGSLDFVKEHIYSLNQSQISILIRSALENVSTEVIEYLKNVQDELGIDLGEISRKYISTANKNDISYYFSSELLLKYNLIEPQDLSNNTENEPEILREYRSADGLKYQLMSPGEIDEEFLRRIRNILLDPPVDREWYVDILFRSLGKDDQSCRILLELFDPYLRKFDRDLLYVEAYIKLISDRLWFPYSHSTYLKLFILLEEEYEVNFEPHYQSIFQSIMSGASDQTATDFHNQSMCELIDYLIENGSIDWNNYWTLKSCCNNYRYLICLLSHGLNVKLVDKKIIIEIIKRDLMLNQYHSRWLLGVSVGKITKVESPWSSFQRSHRKERMNWKVIDILQEHGVWPSSIDVLDIKIKEAHHYLSI